VLADVLTRKTCLLSVANVSVYFLSTQFFTVDEYFSQITMQSLIFVASHCSMRNGLASGYLHVADLPRRRSLCSVGTNRLVVPISGLSTVGSRAFPITSPQTWNDLPEDLTSAESLTTFCCFLKPHLFRKSLLDYILDIN